MTVLRRAAASVHTRKLCQRALRSSHRGHGQSQRSWAVRSSRGKRSPRREQFAAGTRTSSKNNSDVSADRWPWLSRLHRDEPADPLDKIKLIPLAPGRRCFAPRRSRSYVAVGDKGFSRRSPRTRRRGGQRACDCLQIAAVPARHCDGATDSPLTMRGSQRKSLLLRALRQDVTHRPSLCTENHSRGRESHNRSFAMMRCA